MSLSASPASRRCRRSKKSPSARRSSTPPAARRAKSSRIAATRRVDVPREMLFPMPRSPLRRAATNSATAPAGALPRFIPPMLASPGEAFDSADHLFEIKWDGTRALAFVEGGSYRIVNRREIDITDSYPEFSVLAGLPSGTVLDGEIVVLSADGKPDFSALQSREHADSATRARLQAKARPATYMVFDQLYRSGESIMPLSCDKRREMLAITIAALNNPSVIMSQGIVGDGRAYFEQASLECLEGVVAKRLNSPYLP